jgi:hypothetical protein
MLLFHGTGEGKSSAALQTPRIFIGMEAMRTRTTQLGNKELYQIREQRVDKGNPHIFGTNSMIE